VRAAADMVAHRVMTRGEKPIVIPHFYFCHPLSSLRLTRGADRCIRCLGNQRTPVVAGTLRSRDWGIVRHEACSAGTGERHKL
jgi:hypothetical protein